MPGPLMGVRVLDLSRIYAGPWASQLLGDLGAEVIKIERPGVGDDSRTWGPPFVTGPDGKPSGETAYFLGMNRSKASVTVDMAKPEGRDLILSLAQTADIVLENFRPGAMDKLNLGWPVFQAINPRLICCSISGYGRDGPYHDRTAYDFAIQAMGGLMSITGEREDLPGGGPQKVGVAVIDLITGLYAAIGILSALAARERTGEGQVVDIAMLDACVSTLSNQAMNYLLGGTVPRCAGNEHPNIVPQGICHASDGRFVIAVGNDGQFQRLCDALGEPEIAKEPRFLTNALRVRNRGALDDLLRDRFARRRVAEWVEELGRAGVPSGQINDIAQVFADPCVQARGLRFDMEHPTCGAIPQIKAPIRLSETPVSYGRPPPTLGADTTEVLTRLLGITKERVGELRAAGAI